MSGLLALAGCVSAPPPARELPKWELTVAQPARLAPLARVRVSSDRPLPTHLVQQLSPEFSLVTINRPADWAEVHRRLGLAPILAELDPRDGPIVGILAHVGESAENRWPIRLLTVRTINGTALLEAVFRPGFYYPLQTAGYLELAQAPGLGSVTNVRINSRVFMIHSARPPN
jgi:hypothetical protein